MFNLGTTACFPSFTPRSLFTALDQSGFGLGGHIIPNGKRTNMGNGGVFSHTLCKRRIYPTGLARKWPELRASDTKKHVVVLFLGRHFKRCCSVLLLRYHHIPHGFGAGSGALVVSLFGAGMVAGRSIGRSGRSRKAALCFFPSLPVFILLSAFRLLFSLSFWLATGMRAVMGRCFISSSGSCGGLHGTSARYGSDSVHWGAGRVHGVSEASRWHTTRVLIAGGSF